MALITWTQEQYGTTVAKHDEEHKKLFALLNALHDSVGQERATIGQKLDALIAYVVEHFKSEETNMQSHNYPDFAAHKAEHDKLVATCADLQKKFHAGAAEVNAETTAFVKSWLDTHIPNVDLRYGPCLNA